MNRHSHFSGWRFTVSLCLRVSLISVCLMKTCVFAEDWPQFHGPNCSGVSTSTHLPVEFSPTKNLRWEATLGDGIACPIVVAGRLFNTAMTGPEEFSVYCHEAATGKLLWRKTFETGSLPAIMRPNVPASSTPTADADRVYVYFSTIGLFALDATTGEESWRVPLRTPNYLMDWGAAASPVLYQNSVIFSSDDDLNSYLIAIDKASGAVKWKTPRPDMLAGYATPVICETPDRTDIVVAGTGKMKGYDPETGEELWTCNTLLRTIMTSPVVRDGVVYLSTQSYGDTERVLKFALLEWKDTNQDGKLSKAEVPAEFSEKFDKADADRDGLLAGEELDNAFQSPENMVGGGNIIQAIRGGGLGDVTKTHLVWDIHNKAPSNLSSPVVIGDQLFVVKKGGLCSAFDATTGKTLWLTKRLQNLGDYYASPVAADGKIYVTGENGFVVVLRQSNSLEILGKNDLGDSIIATPAIADGRLYFRTKQKILCFAEDKPVSIVVSENAHDLEKLAARELKSQIQKLWGLEVPIVPDSQPGCGNDLWIGSPDSNSAIASAMKDQWPHLSDQGLVLKSVPTNDGVSLVVGGGSPNATLWAAYELGHQWGIRYFLKGDVSPESTPTFQLDGWDLVREPDLRNRVWHSIHNSPIGSTAWGLSEYRTQLQQIAKQKFNRVVLSISPWQPFIDYEFHGVKKETAELWLGHRFPIDGETPGRSAYRGAPFFLNLDLAGKTTLAEFTQASVQMMQGIILESHRLGMTMGLSFSPLEFPREFAAKLPQAKPLARSDGLLIGPGEKLSPTDATLRELATSQLQSMLLNYPTLDAVYLQMPEEPDWAEFGEESWKRLTAQTELGKTVSLKDLELASLIHSPSSADNEAVPTLYSHIAVLDFLKSWLSDSNVGRRPDGKRVEIHIANLAPVLIPYVDELLSVHLGTVLRMEQSTGVSEGIESIAEKIKRRKISTKPLLAIDLADESLGVLPQMPIHRVATSLNSLRDAGWSGTSMRAWLPGDLDAAAHFFSRSAFDRSVSPGAAMQDLVLPNSGEGVSERLLIGWNHVEKASDLVNQNDSEFGRLEPNLVLKHYTTASPLPAWWKEAADHYANAMNEMYRAHDRATPAGRKFLYRLARRYEFGLEYMTAISAVREAGLAKATGDAETQLAKLEAAVESMYNGLNALSTVSADDPSYLGVIAVVTEYGYRPLLKEVETLQDAP